MTKSNYDFLTYNEIQRIVTYTVFLQYHWYLNSCFSLYYHMLISHVLI